jgi:hypothetical protein
LISNWIWFFQFFNQKLNSFFFKFLLNWDYGILICTPRHISLQPFHLNNLLSVNL